MTFQEHVEDFKALQELVTETFYNEDGTAKEATDELKAAVASIVDQWQKDFEKKADGVRKFLVELENQADEWKAEAEKYAKAAKRNEATMTSIKFIVQRTMEQMKVKKIPAGPQSFVIQANPPAMFVQNEMAIPAEYFDIVPQSLKLDTAKLKKDLVDEKEVKWVKPEDAENVTPGAVISRGTSLRIK